MSMHVMIPPAVTAMTVMALAGEPPPWIMHLLLSRELNVSLALTGFLAAKYAELSSECSWHV